MHIQDPFISYNFLIYISIQWFRSYWKVVCNVEISNWLRPVCTSNERLFQSDTPRERVGDLVSWALEGNHLVLGSKHDLSKRATMEKAINAATFACGPNPYFVWYHITPPNKWPLDHWPQPPCPIIHLFGPTQLFPFGLFCDSFNGKLRSFSLFFP